MRHRWVRCLILRDADADDQLTQAVDTGVLDDADAAAVLAFLDYLRDPTADNLRRATDPD
jgi:hypothetical protein